MARAPSHGMGWHGQSLRHRNAKMYGRAGGQYSSYAVKEAGFETRLVTARTDQEAKNKYTAKQGYYGGAMSSNKVDESKENLYQTALCGKYKELDRSKDLTYSQLRKKGVKLKPTKDEDKDGVPNSLDCRPLDKNAQDDGLPKESFFSKVKREYREKKEKSRVEDEEKTKKEIEKLKLDIEREKLEREKQKQHDEINAELARKKTELNKLRDPNREERIKRRHEFLKKAGKIVGNEVKFLLKEPKKHHKRKKKR